MLEVKIAGVAPFDGTYTLDFDDRPFSNREWHLIKQVSGVRMGEFADATAAGDFDLIVAFAAIALVRDGRVAKEMAARAADQLMDAESGSITVEVRDAEPADPTGPPSVPPSGGESQNGPAEISPTSSPTSSSIGGDRPAITPTSTGTPPLGTTPTSPSPISVS